MRTVKIQLIVDAQGAVRGIRTTDGEFQRLENSVDEAGRRISRFDKILSAIAWAAVARAAFGVTKRLFELSQTVEETGSIFRKVFEESADEMDEFGARVGRMAGLTTTEFRQIATQVGALFRGVGFEGDQLVEHTQQALTLAGDLASAYNTTIEDAFQALRSGLSGESEPLRRFGVFIQNNTKGLSEQEKVADRLGQVYRSLIQQNILGDLADTQDSVANKTRVANRDLRQQAEILATELSPAFRQVTESAAEFIAENQGLFAGIARLIASRVTGTLENLTRFKNAFQGTIQFVQGVVLKGGADIQQGLARIFDTIPGLGRLASAMREVAGDLEAVGQRSLDLGLEKLDAAFSTVADGADDLSASLGTGGGADGGGGGGTGLGTAAKQTKTEVEKLGEEINNLAMSLASLESISVAELAALEQQRQALQDQIDLRREMARLRVEGPTVDLQGAPLDEQDISLPEPDLSGLDAEVEALEAQRKAAEDAALAKANLLDANMALAAQAGAALASEQKLAAGIAQASLTVIDAYIARFVAKLAERNAFLGIAGAFLAAAAGAALRRIVGGFFRNPSSGGSSAPSSVAAASTPQGASEQAAGIQVNNLPRRQFGGPVTAGNPFLVGEGGPEIFVPSRSGGILPNSALQSLGRQPSLERAAAAMASSPRKLRVETSGKFSLEPVDFDFFRLKTKLDRLEMKVSELLGD